MGLYDSNLLLCFHFIQCHFIMMLLGVWTLEPETWIQILPLPLPSSVTLGNLISLSVGLLFHRMRTTTVSTTYEWGDS